MSNVLLYMQYLQSHSFISYVTITIQNETDIFLYLIYSVLCKFTWYKEGKQFCFIAEGMASSHHCLNNCSLEPGFASAKQLPFLLPSPGSKNSKQWCTDIFFFASWSIFHNIMWMLGGKDIAEVTALQTHSIKTRCWIYSFCCST